MYEPDDPCFNRLSSNADANIRSCNDCFGRSTRTAHNHGTNRTAPPDRRNGTQFPARSILPVSERRVSPSSLYVTFHMRQPNSRSENGGI